MTHPLPCVHVWQPYEFHLGYICTKCGKHAWFSWNCNKVG